MLELKNYTKSYVKGKTIVDNLSLKVEKGDIYAFVGHNGAGKTTTIKSIVGILEFDKGDILIDNKSIKKNEIECKMKMAYIPDNPDLYEHLKGISYLNFIADIYKVSKEKREELIKKYAEKFELTKNLGDPISSSGDLQRQSGSFRHDGRVIAENLSAAEAAFILPQELSALLILIHQCPGGYHFRHRHTGTKLRTDSAVGPVGNSGHGSQEYGIFNFYISNIHKI